MAVLGADKQRTIVIQRLGATTEPALAHVNRHVFTDGHAGGLPFVGHFGKFPGADPGIIGIQLVQDFRGKFRAVKFLPRLDFQRGGQRAQFAGKFIGILVHIQSDTAPQAGDALFGQGPAEQSGGMIVNAQPAPQGGYDALAVILNTSLESGDVAWKTPDGPVLQLLSLPYSVE